MHIPSWWEHNYCTSCNQILLNNKDRQLHTVGWVSLLHGSYLLKRQCPFKDKPCIDHDDDDDDDVLEWSSAVCRHWAGSSSVDIPWQQRSTFSVHTASHFLGSSSAGSKHLFLVFVIVKRAYYLYREIRVVEVLTTV